MKQFALVLQNGNIKNIVVANSINDLTGNYIEYSNSNPANRKGTYNSSSKKFVNPKPYPSWTLKNDIWKAPIEKPINKHNWNEKNKIWEKLN